MHGDRCHSISVAGQRVAGGPFGIISFTICGPDFDGFICGGRAKHMLRGDKGNTCDEFRLTTLSLQARKRFTTLLRDDLDVGAGGECYQLRVEW